MFQTKTLKYFQSSENKVKETVKRCLKEYFTKDVLAMVTALRETEDKFLMSETEFVKRLAGNI